MNYYRIEVGSISQMRKMVLLQQASVSCTNKGILYGQI